MLLTRLGIVMMRRDGVRLSNIIAMPFLMRFNFVRVYRVGLLKGSNGMNEFRFTGYMPKLYCRFYD